MSLTSENAENLFKRLLNANEQEQRVDIDSRLFPNSIIKSDICEICGQCGSGKTELLLHLLTRCLLPVKWSTPQACVDLSQHSCSNSGVTTEPSKIILIDTDGKFSILRLFSILETRLKHAVKQQGLDKTISASQIEQFIRQCLKSLTVYRCFTNEQFLVTLASCEHFIKAEQKQNKNSLSLLFIDSINSTFEYIDKFLFNDQFYTEKYTVSLIKRLILRYNVGVIVTRNDFETSGAKSYLKWQSLITKRINLNKCLSNEQMKILYES